MLQPELLGEVTDVRLAADDTVQPQPATFPLAAELPSGQYGVDRWRRGPTPAPFTDLIEEPEGEQHPRASLGWSVGPCVGHSAQGGIREALGQFKAACPDQFQLLALTCGRQAEAWGPIPEHPERFLAGELR